MDDLADLRDELSDLAVELAAGYGAKLDYTVRSVKRVEKVLAKIHRYYEVTGDDEGLNGVSMEFGAYLIKVIEQNFEPGTWRRDHDDLGAGTFPYSWRGEDLFPFAWCRKRIFGGKGDNVWSKFKTLVRNK